MSQANSKPVSARVLDAAIAWQLCLDCGNGSEVEQAEFAKWYAASEEHARAWLQLGMLDHRFSTASVPARNALLKARDSAHHRMRKIGSGLASLALVIGLTVLAGKNYLPMDYWMADQRTATGEQRVVTLADGTRRSVLPSRVAAHPEHTAAETGYAEGQQVVMHRDGLGQRLALNPGADAWTRGMLVLDNVRLSDMVSELNRYRRGHLGVDPDVADLRITGSFPLHNIELALNALLPTLPVQITQRTPWWVPVSGKPEAR